MRRRRTTTVLLGVLVCLVAATPGTGTGAPVASPVAVAADGAVAPSGAYGWPLAGVPRVGRPFAPPESTYGRGHRGVDLVAVAGAPVLSAGAGTVVFAGPLAGRGVVSVQHPDGLRTTYEPVTASVAVGQAVPRGGPLGVVQPGHAGCPAPACLHWGVRRGADTYLDPLRLVGRWPVRLLPWAG